MKKIISLIILLVIIPCIPVIAQKKEKILYYNVDWIGCTKSKAKYYRVYFVDNNNDPIGEIRDYYISGKIQMIAESAIKIDSKDDANSLFKGEVKVYIENGLLHEQGYFSDDGIMVRGKEYYSNGNIEFDYSFDANGELDGICKEYYESGKIYRKYNFGGGKLKEPFFLEFDEFGNCQNVFEEDFDSEIRFNNWGVEDDTEYYKSELSDGGLCVETKSDIGCSFNINIPLNLKDNFTIETTIELITGSTNTGQGLIWGLKDWDNYHYFYIANNGHFMLGSVAKGINLETVKWTRTDAINTGYARNLMKVLRIKDNLVYAINGKIVFTSKFYPFLGSNIGLSIPYGKKKLKFENLKVTQDQYEQQNNTNLEVKEWKENGTGFFVSTNGVIATNYHVIENFEDVQVEFNRDGEKQLYNAEIVLSDKQNDLAILKISDIKFQNFDSLPYNFQNRTIDVGTSVFALGYPLTSIMGKEIKFTDGKISARTGYRGDISTYQMTTPLQPGNSGGPLFDYDGNVVGINSAGLKNKVIDNVSYAIKFNYLRNLIDVLPNKINLDNKVDHYNMKLTEKIKLFSGYVVLVKVK